MHLRYFLLLVSLLLSYTHCRSQIKDSTVLKSIHQKLISVSAVDSCFLCQIDISTSKLSVSEIIKNIATVSNANIIINASDSKIVSCNFKNARVIDIIFFLCKEYNFDIEIIENIVSIFPYTPLPPQPIKPNIDYNIEDSTITIDISGLKLIDVAKAITEKTGYNIIIPQNLYNTSISGYIYKIRLDEAIHILATINNLEILQNRNGINYISTANEKDVVSQYKPSRKAILNGIKVDSLGHISSTINNGNVQDLIIDVFDKLNLNYHFITPISKKTSVYVHKVSLDRFLNIMFSGTNYTWTVKDSIYMFGNFEKEKALVAAKVISMKYRSVEKVIELIPDLLKANISIHSFPDLNSIVVSGEQKGINEIEQFLIQLDKRVPLINIDILIVESTKSDTKDLGINMGIGTDAPTTSGTISPGIDLTLNASSIDKLLNNIHGLGAINLGSNIPNFYASIKMLEESGKILLKSTPKLSTLNGYEANLKSGETQYYKEVQSSLYGSDKPIESKSYTWKSVEANLSLKIMPLISKDSCITLKIDLEQSEFTERTEEEAPPGMTTRSFKSILNVRSGDIVLLGGIEKNLSSNTSKGLPLLSKIPLIKWLFGSTSRHKNDYKLNIFIKSTVIY